VLEIKGIIHRIDYPAHRAQIMMLQDITELRQSEERLQQLTKKHQLQLTHLSQFDLLTGLPSRELLNERMQQGIKQAKLTNRRMAILYIDLDDYGRLNEKYGKHTGDNMLISVSDSIRSCMHGGDTLARIGSDEFVMLLVIQTDEELHDILNCVQKRITSPYMADEFTISLSASIGITIYPDDSVDPDTLLRHADQAMMESKQLGKGKFLLFDTESDKRIRTHKEMIVLMREALARREFVLYYQPKVDMSQGKVIGAEALIRWQHPQRGLLPPGAFLPEIEEDLFMIELSEWVIAEALAQMSRWRSIGLDLAVSVNIAALHLLDTNFVPRLQVLLSEQVDTPRGRLEIEVLETSALNDMQKVQEIVSACQHMGVGFSLDDFGTGYSSLTYLRHLSADTLKIDQSFVRNMLEVNEDLAIISGVIGLAAAFKRNVIAEGVETIAHGHALLQLGCVQAQGYGIARPMPGQDLPAWVAQWPDAAWLALSA
jgi:diguanylate cyclase (GGDEF)-like protein